MNPQPWPRLEAGLRAARQRRRRRAALTGGVAALSVLLLAGGVGVLAAGPSGRERGTPPATELSDLPTRGSLAGDAGFLAALRAGPLRGVPPGTTPGQIKVVYAGDLGAYRLALLDVPAPEQPRGRGHLWLYGHAGDAVPELAVDSVRPAGRTAWTWIPALDLKDYPDFPRSGTGALIVLGPDEPRLVGAPTYRADGSVDWPGRPVQRSGAGWWQELVPWTATDQPSMLTVRGLQPPVPLALAPRPALLGDAVNRAALPPVHGTVPPEFGTELSQEQWRSRLPVPGSTRRVLWVGRPAGLDFSMVVAVTAPSGAHVLIAGIGQVNRTGHVGTNRVRVAPAGPLERIGMAWRIPDHNLARHDLVVLMAPDGATRARLYDADGTGQDVALVAGAGHVSLPVARRPARAEFLDAAGRVVAECPVSNDQEILPPMP